MNDSILIVFAVVTEVFWCKLNLNTAFMSIAASHVISDQTELRLLEQNPRRTDVLMHKWGCRNGTIGELLRILEDLQLFRPRDIILECMHDFIFFISLYVVICLLLLSLPHLML